MECVQITCENCKELGNETCPYKNENNSYGNIYEVVYENKKVTFLLVRIRRSYYLIDVLDRISNSVGPFKNLRDVEEFLKEDAILIDKNMTKLLTMNKKKKYDAYKKRFIKEESELFPWEN